MAIFGRNTARQRLRRAARESLKIPAFSAPVDCTPWVTGGLWPAELSTVTTDTAPLVKYLKTDLQRIVNSANEELKGIRRAGLADPTREAEEARVITDARAFAVRRVESTVRHLRNTTPKLPTPYQPVNGADDVEKTPRFKLAPPRPEPEEPTEALETPDVHEGIEETTRSLSSEELSLVEELESWEPADTVTHDAVVDEQESMETAEFQVPRPFDSDDTEVFEDLATLLHEISPPTAAAVGAPTEPEPVEPEPESYEPVTRPVSMFESVSLAPVVAEPEPEPVALEPEPVALELEPEPVALEPEPESYEPVTRPVSMFESVGPPPVDAEPPTPPVPSELEHERLERLLKFVARQEPGLRWAIGNRGDGTTVLVTDLAHGWIPPGITLPAEVHLLEPARRTGTAKALLGDTTLSATYAPGDPLGWASDYAVADTSLQPRELPTVDDLGWVLSEATHWRDGLPRIVNTMAKAGAAGTGIADAEIDILRVYLDTSRYQLVAQYPDIDAGLLLNCLLLAATEGIATMNHRSANYHFAWFHTLSAPPRSGWKAGA